MKKNIQSTFSFIKKRKFLSTLVLVGVLGLGYYTYGKVFSTAGQTSYVVAYAKTGIAVSNITGTGQVSASSQSELKSKVSGDIVYLNIKDNGAEVKKGTLIAQVDARDATISLESAKIAYRKLIKPADDSERLATENAYSDALSANKKAYDDAFNNIAETFSELLNILTGIDTLLHGQGTYLQSENIRSLSQTAFEMQGKASDSYYLARVEYDKRADTYRTLSRTSPPAIIASFTNDTYTLAKNVSNAVKDTQNVLDFVKIQKSDTSVIATTASTNVSSWLSTINADLANLLSSKNSIVSTAQTIAKTNADLVDQKNGADVLDIATQKLDLQKKQNDYDDYFIRSPFDGILARLSVKATDTVSNGTTIGTVISPRKIVTISLNEVDVEKVRVSQKAELVFDAINDLKIEGTVITVDLVGTISQGVVNYNIEISLDTQDVRVKSGMSVTAKIITETKENVLVVPSGAVKTQGGKSYVEVFDQPLEPTADAIGTPSAIAPVRKNVDVGISNDTVAEVVSGLKEGEQVVLKATAPAGTAKKPAK